MVLKTHLQSSRELTAARVYNLYPADRDFGNHSIDLRKLGTEIESGRTTTINFGVGVGTGEGGED